MPPAAWSQQRVQTETERYVSYFDTVVFGSEFAGRSSSIIRKWTEPVRYKLGGNTAAIAKYRPVVQGHLAQLAIFSGLKFDEIGPRDPGENLIIYFSTYDKMIEDGRMLAQNPAEIDRLNLKTANCFFLSYFLPDGKMVAGRVVANAELADQEISTACWKNSPRRWACRTTTTASHHPFSTTASSSPACPLSTRF